MSAAAKLREIETLTVDERIDLVQAIWNGIAAETEGRELSEGEKQMLDRRIADLDAQPSNVRTWEEIKARVHPERIEVVSIQHGRKGDQRWKTRL